MSGRARSRSRGRGDGQESSDPVEPVVAQQPRDEQPQQEEPPTENQDVEPGQEGENEGAPAVEEPGPEIDGQEMGLGKTGGERGDGPDVKGKTPPNLEAARIPEAGDGKP
ncbi:P antigen family member 4 [Dasypus novemcinctus]|uniref:P antigen family member 4 n=1 Tax=Dasypus novemcinctus TaxID=9361 RepID=UPI000328BC49|nr:P antigen family member 4 [Dasypus novemcinctus]XP_012383211.1 P antigen family member 4 [Dasypus novemcinctus]XP_023446474.1 P antigen family member 4 [Dasypus novemcinctus]XP_023446475.1 P antigen family member 4 [Dasypus novemcinctus]XP_058147273.1 P antigen family member 4 [Dasypus novemcinctus]